MEGRTQLAPTPVEDFENGDFLMATKILTTRIRHDPNNYELYFERSICHHKLGNYQASLEDADAAIKLNPSNYNIHYQRSLALIRLYMFDDALRSALKAIELRAARSDTKMSDIFKLIKDHIREMKIVREHLGENGQHQARANDFGDTTAATSSSSNNNNNNNNNNSTFEARLSSSGEPVDSTTDRLLTRPSPQNNFTSTVDHVDRINNNLVMTNCNNSQPSLESATKTNQMVLAIGSMGNKVSSSAIHRGNSGNTDNNVQINQMSSSIGTAGDDYSNMNASINRNHVDDRCKASSQFEWNIRRSERIFLHNTSEPGTSSPQLIGDNTNRTAFGSNSRHSNRPESNPSSVSTLTKTETKKNNSDKSRVITGSSHLDSDVGVEHANPEQIIATDQSINSNPSKRVMVAPSSSMPATSQTTVPSNSTSKDDSYSSKYKRLRRDRERARRGTSKLCTIRPSDLEDLQRSGSDKSYMRVIAPIDGWLYSGQLSVDDGPREEATSLPHYVVKLDGDSSGSSYLFTQETVLNDVIKEVKVKSVSDLRKGARICCYWSRTYKCLSTGVVTSRTFEATKSLVSVKYDNGDLSALPLEDLRLLPPDYPKYMSNCDPLLLARNGDGLAPTEQANTEGASRIVVSGKSACVDHALSGPIMGSTQEEPIPPEGSDSVAESSDDNKLMIDDSHVSFQPIDQDDSDDDDVIPPTNQAIDFITNENIGSDSDGETEKELDDRDIAGDNDNVMLANEPSQMVVTNGSRASSEENNFGVEYRPWVFEGAPKRNKRHGRTYRDNYTTIRRGNEVLRIGDSAELMPRDSSILPFIAKIDGLWCTSRGEMRVRVRWYYRLVETEDGPCDLKDGENALFETDHVDENDVQSIWRSSKIMSWTEYSKSYIGHVNKQHDGPKVFYLAGYYDPVRRIKHLRSDVKEVQ